MELFYSKNKDLFNSVHYKNETMSNVKLKIVSFVNNCFIDNVLFNFQNMKDAMFRLRMANKRSIEPQSGTTFWTLFIFAFQLFISLNWCLAKIRIPQSAS